MAALVLVEHDNQLLKAVTLNTVAAALACTTEVDLLITGDAAKSVAQAAAQITGVRKVILIEADFLSNQLAEPVTEQILALAPAYDYILAPATSHGKNVLPRVAAKLDVAQISDITQVVSADTFERPIYAGNAIATVQSSDPKKIITVRTTGFDAVAATGGSASINEIAAVADQHKSSFVGRDLSKSDRPELTAAKIIVSGGRGLGSSEKYHELIEPLADQLGAALGASRAAVDAGYVPNDYQVGQTGKIVAPQLYIAVGISGAIQHLAGMKDSKVIVAINKDPEAPIFGVADYGLVADLFTAIPELTELLKRWCASDMTYLAPVKEMLFVMQELAGLAEVARYPLYAEAGADGELASAVLEESAKFNQAVVAPLNWEGDKNPSIWNNGAVIMTAGFKEALKQYAEAGWQGLIHPPQYGGQGLPKLIATPCLEMVNAANLSFALCPLLTDGAIEAILIAANEDIKAQYLPALIAGTWAGTMNLTESQAGSDLSLVRSRADPQADGSYLLFGTKIYITYGEHDMTDNIVHLVLARTPNAPAGVKGISLFVVPKFLLQVDGSLGARNEVECISIEHKLGIKASPTAVLQFGDQRGAIGYLVGEENRGLEYMFVMMNASRFAVGIQGIAVADRAYQKAVAYAKDRVQSRDLEGSTESVAIIHQPDVKRMLLTMRAYTEASRALAYFAAAQSDAAHAATVTEERTHGQALYEFLVPIVKGFSTEMAIEVASLGVQVHGGMGFIEETGAAQFYRDARILTIYEGTTAIQANDLIGRKTLRDGGKVAQELIASIVTTEANLRASNTKAALAVLKQLQLGRAAFEQVLRYILQQAKPEIKAVYAGSYAYLKLCGLVLGAWQMARALLAAERLHNQDPAFYSAKIITTQFFAENILPQATALAASITEGGAITNAMTIEQF